MNNWTVILLSALVTCLIRVLPLTLIRRPIRNRFLQSFLYYVPYVTLAVMTFPGILTATQTPWSAVVALVAGIILAWRGKSLLTVAVAACCAVAAAQGIMLLI